MSTDMRRDEGQYYPYGKRVMPAEHPGGDMKHADFEGINDLPERFTDEDVRTKLNTVLGALRGTSAALAIGLAAFTLAASGDPLAVHKARKGSVYNDQEIVTNVTFDAAIPSVALTNETLYVDGWKTNVVTRWSNGAVDIIGSSRSPGNGVGAGSIASGYRVSTPGAYSLAWGNYSRSLANYARAYGLNSSAEREYSIAIGIRAVATNEYALSWQGGPTDAFYFSHGAGTFNINPFGGVDGFWIGETNFAQHVRNIAGSGGGGSAAPKRIAMFIVPVNVKPDTSAFPSNPAYGFELKASTNNFANGASENVKLQFYAQSEIADTGSGTSIDTMKLYKTTTSESSDIRALDRISNTVPYQGYELVEVVVLVDVSCLRRHTENNGEWLSDQNEDLTWCYLRNKSGDGVETHYNAANNKFLWRPIAPVRWFRELPAWAR